MTKIDRYILILFLRTVLVCFLSLAGIFIVFHAFTAIDDLVALTDTGESLPSVLVRFYGPYLILLFDMTGTIITLMSFLFTVGWLRRTGELTATLSAGISHGRIFRPMIVASLVIISAQLACRECVIPQFRSSLTMEAEDLNGEIEQAVRPTFDRFAGILIEGAQLETKARIIEKPNFRIDSEYAGFGDILIAREAVWMDASEDAAAAPPVSGYLLREVKRPESIGTIASARRGDQPVLLTSADQDWLNADECFVATTVHPNMLQTQDTATRLASVWELSGRVRNSAVHSSLTLQTQVHERIVRAPLDFALVMLVLPLVVNARGRKIFVLIGSAVGMVLAFFALKTLAGALGGSGTLFTPGIAAWVPLLVVAPLAYVRFRAVQRV
ncbi:LptF/LptG family permease [Allorhodopirellula solitaria]|uniref:Putative permease YjgP/YjgQ family protein n=1 Tax=Allorhodopirellula solitaria TaxID=2527987 RepID=A0A5C5YKC8_9BACT|nr:LptF/LptG family permease [Allorhodopirellula solitaria]TWT75324.1 putative permease YjgP/YjgQ family protein [Allorhodopirellula solitaria]